MRANKPGLTIEPYTNDVRQWQAESSRAHRQRQREEQQREANRKAGLFSSPEEMDRYMSQPAAPAGPAGIGAKRGSIGEGVRTGAKRGEEHTAGGKKGRIGPRSSVFGENLDKRPGVTDISYSKSSTKAPSVSQVEHYIRDAAVKRGINPDTAVKVAKSEGLKPGAWQSNVTKNGKREKSFGPFQLNTEKGRLGVQFTKATGLDPRDPATVEAQIDFALDHAAKNGWGSWYGAAKIGVANRQGLAKARPIGVQAVAAAPAGGLASFFAGPLGMKAQAADLPVPQSRPVGGIMAKAAPALADNAFSKRFDAQPAGLLGTPADAYSVNGVDVAESPAAIDRLSREQMAQPAQLSQPSFDARFAGLTPSNPPSITPPGNMATATPDQRMGDTFGLPGLTDLDRSALAQASAKFDPGAVKASGLSRLGPPATDVASMPGGIRSAAKPGQVTDEQGNSFADPFGNYQPGGIMAQASAPKMQNSLTNPETATGPTVMSQPAAPKEARLGTPAPEQAAPTDVAANVNAGWEANHPVNTAFDDQYEAAAAQAAPDLGPAQDVPDYSVADVAQDPAVSQEPTIGSFPDAPGKMGIMDRMKYDPEMAPVKDAVKGLALGGPVGALLGGGMGLLGNRLGPGFDAAVPSADRFSVGSGLPGIMGALGGKYGATANSLSNPGMSVTSLGNGQSLRRSEKFGWTEVVGPDGSVVGIQYDNPDKKGLLGSVSKRMGGILGGRQRGRDVSPGAQHAIDSGQGGLY